MIDNTKPNMKIAKKDLRIFSFIWTLIFFGIAIYPLYQSGFSALLAIDSIESFDSLNIRHWSLLTALFFFLIGIFIPKALSTFYRLWTKLGELMAGVISKIILLLLFYGLFAPIGIMLRLLRKDLLHKKLDKNCSSYWQLRTEQPGSLKKQF